MPSIANAATVAVANLSAALLRPLQATTTVELSNLLQAEPASAKTYANDARLSYVVNQALDLSTSVTSSGSAAATAFPAYSAPRIESLVASSAEDLNSFGDVTFDIFDDNDDLYGSPLAFDASEHGLWNGRFVPPPPRPPFFVDEPVRSDGLTTCDLCSWAMPTKSTFIFEGTIEKATELGWPLTLIIVSVLSALFGAIIMIAVVRCRRKKSSNNRNDTHVQWWSRNKRPHSNGLSGSVSGVGGASIASNNGHNNNNHLRRSNIYTAHPADSIRGLQQPSLSASSSLTAMTSMMVTATAAPTVSSLAAVPGAAAASTLSSSQPPQYFQPYQHQHHLPMQLQQGATPMQQLHRTPHYPHECSDDTYEYEEPEYHQPQELQLQLQHQRQHSSSMSSINSSPSLMLSHQMQQHQPSMLPLPLPLPMPMPTDSCEANSSETCHWPQATTMVVAS